MFLFDSISLLVCNSLGNPIKYNLEFIANVVGLAITPIFTGVELLEFQEQLICLATSAIILGTITSS